MRAEPALLELKLNYRFNDPELLHRALTHSSLANESRPGSGAGSPLNDNEQLEFLGDSVLGFLIAEALVRRFPEYHEGDLSRLKAHLVSAAHLHGVARRLELGEFLELGRSEEMSGGRTKKTLLVDGLGSDHGGDLPGWRSGRGAPSWRRTLTRRSSRRRGWYGHTTRDHEFQERASGTGAIAQAAAAALLRGAGARAGAFEDLHGGSPGGERLDRPGRRTHQENCRAARSTGIV